MKATTEKSTANRQPAKAAKPFFSRDGEGTFFSEMAGGELQTEDFFDLPVEKKNTPHVQAKLDVGKPDDPLEREADAVADHVVKQLGNTEPSSTNNNLPANTLSTSIQTKTAGVGQEEKLRKKEEEDTEPLPEKILLKSIFESNDPPPDDNMVQTKPLSLGTRPTLQSKDALPASSSASTSVESTLASSKGSGAPLPDKTRSQMESSFGADFSNVRIHDDSSAEHMSDHLQAKAFTHGSDIYFNSGKFNTNSKEGKHLLAHELTHTIQQGNSPAKSMDAPASSKVQRAKKDVVQRSVLDDVLDILKSVGEFLLGIVAGILEWIGELIMGLLSLAGGLLELIAAADSSPLASLGLLGLIVLVILAVAFPEVSIPVLIILGVAMGILNLARHIIMIFNPLLSAYEKGKHLGKAIMEAVLLAVSAVEILQFGKAFRAISQLSEGVGAAQKIRWLIQLRRFGSLESSLAILEEVNDIEKSIQFLELVGNADKALDLMKLERNIDVLMEILRTEGVVADDVLRLLGKPGMTGNILKSFLRNADGSRRMTIADIDRLLSHSKIGDNVAQLESLANHAKIANVADLEALLNNTKLATGAELQALLGSTKITDSVQLAELLNNAKVTSAAELQALLNSTKITSGVQLGELLNHAKILNAAELQGLLSNIKITSGTQLAALLNNGKIADAAQLQRLLNSAKIPDGVKLRELLVADITDDATQLERLLSLVNSADDVVSYVNWAGGKGQLARLEDLLTRAVAKGDVTKAEGILKTALGDPIIFQKLTEAIPLLNAPPIVKPGFALHTPIPPYNSLTANAMNGHFLDHTFEYVNLAVRKDVIPGTTFWPVGTSPATVEARVQEAVNVLTSTTPPTIISSGNPRPVALPSGWEVQVGTQGPVTNLRIGQFFPTQNGGGIHFTQLEIAALWKLLY